MNKNKTVTINGKQYDAVTGMALKGAEHPPTIKHPTNSTVVHAAPQKSKTLVRRATKKPAGAPRPARKPGQTMDIARSHSISRFAPHPVTVPKKEIVSQDIPATHHPIVTKVRSIQAAKKAPIVAAAPLTSKEVKERAIATALATPVKKTRKKHFLKRYPKFVTIISISLIVALAAAYVTYLNMPVLSVRVAAAQAGIDATYPQFQPDGYRLDGPVTFTDGAVSIHFAANTGSNKFSITQAKSSWDSTAVLDNIVRKSVGDKYIITEERGLTIYTYSGNAAWVNAGILYTIQGDAPLSGEQIRHIATSL